MAQQYDAHGKVLLTSEFMILHGAKALAVPLTLGQSLTLSPKRRTGELHWTAQYAEKTWFETTLSLDDLNILDTHHRDRSENLVRMLRALLKIKPGFIEQLRASDVITSLEFDPEFGFGSSSTLTSLLAQWARAGSAILYQVINEMPVVETIDFQPPFIDNMWLVYLGQKQESDKSVAAFLNNYEPEQKDIEHFSTLTHAFLRAKTADELGAVMERHENRLSEILNMPALKSKRFPDLDGYIKSLGAWGGDFALLVTSRDNDYLFSYLQEKGINKWFAYKQIAI